MDFIRPIYDRVIGDVEKVRQYELRGYDDLIPSEKAEWSAGLKGALNASDVNRIENNLKFLAESLQISGLTFKTNWTYSDILVRSHQRRILNNFEAIKSKYIFEHDPGRISPPLNGYQKVNTLEKAILDMYDAYNHRYGSYNFVTSDSKNFKSYPDQNFLVIGAGEEVILQTKYGEDFETKDSELFSTSEKIIVRG